MKFSGLFNIQIALDSGKILVASSGPASKIHIPTGYMIQPAPEIADALTIGKDSITIRAQKKPYTALIVQDSIVRQMRVYTLDRKMVEAFTAEAMMDKDVANFVTLGKARLASLKDRAATQLDGYEDFALLIIALVKGISAKLIKSAGAQLTKHLKAITKKDDHVQK